MPHFLGGHICPKMSRSFPGSVLGASGSVRRESSQTPGGLAQGHRQWTVAASAPLRPGDRVTAARAGVQARRALLRPCALKDLTLTSPTTPRHRTECPGRPQGLRGGGHGVARSGPRGPPSRAGRCAVFVVGRCHGMLRRLSAEAQRQVWLSPAIPGPGRWVAPSPVTLRGQILEAGRDVVSSPHARRPPSARGSIYTTVVAKHCKLPATVDPPPCPRGS